MRDSPSSSPSLVSVMRALSAGDDGVFFADSFAAQTRRHLITLRDVYGAAEKHNGRWRATYTPQWFDKRRLPFSNCLLVDETASTNDLLLQTTPPAFAFAEYQTRGRGRRGNCWRALPGASLLFSVCLPSPPGGAVFGLSLAMGAALWRALGCHPRLRIKWPNDLSAVDGKKIGGVLVEIKQQKVIIGVGINLKMTDTFCKTLARPAAGLTEVIGAATDKNSCAATMGQAITAAWAIFNRNGVGAFLEDAKRAHLIAAGDYFLFRDDDGKQRRGIFRGFDSDGALIINDGGDSRRYVCGEISHVVGG